MAKHEINSRNFKYPATTKNTRGVFDFSPALKRSMPKPKKNYFTKQKMKFGDDWISKKNDQDLENGVKEILRNLVKGIIANEEFYYFYNQKFSAAVRKVVYDSMESYRVLARAADTLLAELNMVGEILPQHQYEVLTKQQVLFKAYSDFQNALVKFSELSPNAEMAINYMVEFQRYMNRTYSYAINCFSDNP